jgi:hypothetical protein
MVVRVVFLAHAETCRGVGLLASVNRWHVRVHRPFIVMCFLVMAAEKEDYDRRKASANRGRDRPHRDSIFPRFPLCLPRKSPTLNTLLNANARILRALAFAARVEVEFESEVLRLRVGALFELNDDLVAIAFR